MTSAQASITVMCNNPGHTKAKPTLVAKFQRDPGGSWSVLGRHHDSRRPTSPGKPNVRTAHILASGATKLPGLACNLCGRRLPESINTNELDSLVAHGVSCITINELCLLGSKQL